MIDRLSIRFGALALLILFGCNSDPAGVSQFDLAIARGKWNRSGIEDYQVDFRFQGFLSLGGFGFMRLQVAAGQVVSAQPLDTADHRPLPPLDAWPTVPRLFNLIEEEGGSTHARVSATFDERLGYPRLVDITCVDNLPDCGVSYQFRNLEPLFTINKP